MVALEMKKVKCKVLTFILEHMFSEFKPVNAALL